MLLTQWADIFNIVANLATIIGGAVGGTVVIYVLIQVRRMAAENKRIAQGLEQVLAPKMGIEGFLNMCAQVVECDPDGTCVVSDNGEIVLVNKSMEDICGFHRSELIGQSVETLVPDAHKGIHPAHREGFIVGPSSRSMRGLKLKHKRGGAVDVGINLNHYRDSSGGYTIAKVRVPSREEARRSDEVPAVPK